ncbi:Hint domain-containing protein [Candidatus Rhodobacter oscarellae]|uniref:Hint domain-containing protein n=1 Tax=Candidatus Rhodobacter oscarellae TaxID=1675527 RepID=UPI001F3EB082|nr:Hint domain-containing protein [Candidatus Rhodobacter lobularis]
MTTASLSGGTDQGDGGTYSFVAPVFDLDHPGVTATGNYTSTNTTTGEFTYVYTYDQWVSDGLPGQLILLWGNDSVSIPGTYTINITCFHAGTMIATPDGERAVETLAIGDLVRTVDGRAVPVKWLGRQTLRTLMNPSPRLQPVRIAKGALGQGLPHTDLTLTADHGMVLGGLMINASALVNGGSIRFLTLEEVPPDYTVYHIETEAHDVILANGAPAETFLDAAGRAAFDNHAEYLDLYGAERIIPEMRMPRISTARLLPQAIKDRLAISQRDHLAMAV